MYDNKIFITSLLGLMLSGGVLAMSLPLLLMSLPDAHAGATQWVTLSASVAAMCAVGVVHWRPGSRRHTVA